jgi:phospholipase/carboxylesterase
MDAIIVEPPKKATASIIWLHGLGANGNDFEPIVPELPNEITQHSRFIFPNAPMRPITINGGMVMRGWYDIEAMDLTQRQDIAGTKESQQLVDNFIGQEMDMGIASDKIILAGFSQGGAIALYAGLRSEHKLAGIMALSTYLPFADSLPKERHTANQDTSIFYGHGEYDPVIPLAHGEQSYRLLGTLGYQVAWHTYAMEHSVYPEEIKDIGQWLIKCLN